MPWFLVCLILSTAGIIGSILNPAWLLGTIPMVLFAWRLSQCGVALRPGGAQVRNIWSRAQFVPWQDVDHFATTRLTRGNGRPMLFGTLVRKDSTRLPTFGITAVPAHPRRADVVVAQLNAILESHRDQP